MRENLTQCKAHLTEPMEFLVGRLWGIAEGMHVRRVLSCLRK